MPVLFWFCLSVCLSASLSLALSVYVSLLMTVSDGVLVCMVAPAAPVVPKELREKAVLGANIQKDGHDPPILADRLVFFLSFFFWSPPSYNNFISNYPW